MVTSELERQEDQQLEEEQSAAWLGLKLAEFHVLINLADVIEVLPVPSIQPVPLTKQWFLGMANVRGNLVSISSMAQLMQMPAQPIKPSSRIVLFNSVRTTQAAIVVDGVLGLQHIETMRATAIDFENNGRALREYRHWFEADGLIDKHGKQWLRLDVDHLLRDPVFLQPGLGA